MEIKTCSATEQALTRTGEMIGGGDCLSAISITVEYVMRPVRNLASLAAIDIFGITTGASQISFSLLPAEFTPDHDLNRRLVDSEVCVGGGCQCKDRIFTWIHGVSPVALELEL